MSLKLTLKEYLDAMHKVASIYFNNLKANKQALDYLYSRGLTDEEIDKYYIGYADVDPYSLSTLLHQDFKQEHFETLGMFINQEGRFIDRFAGRIIFPVCDVQGNIVSFCGRGFEGGISKYLNMPDSLYAGKKFNLFALNYVIDSIYSKHHVFLVEGLLDCVAMHRTGFKNAIGLLGTTVTRSQLSDIRLMTDTVYILLDGDAAGQTGALTVKKVCEDLGFITHILSLPIGYDPDSLLKAYGPHRFREFILAQM